MPNSAFSIEMVSKRKGMAFSPALHLGSLSPMLPMASQIAFCLSIRATTAALAPGASVNCAGVVPMAENAFDNLHFFYKLSGDAAYRPEQVFDDSQHTYLIYPNDGRF